MFTFCETRFPKSEKFTVTNSMTPGQAHLTSFERTRISIYYSTQTLSDNIQVGTMHHTKHVFCTNAQLHVKWVIATRLCLGRL
jgi:hypothetical protein